MGNLETIQICFYESKIGIIKISSNDRALVGLEFVNEKTSQNDKSSILQQALFELDEYFGCEYKNFNLPLEFSGTTFQKSVWNELLLIPYGETRSYKQVSETIGRLNAQRAIGNANNKNKIAIIVPCHRVIGSSGKLVGYAGELWRKKWLLEHEKKLKGMLDGC